MKKRLSIEEIILIISVCVIPIFLSFWIFSEFNDGATYIIIVYSLYGAFEEIFEVYLQNKEKDLETKLNRIGVEICIYSIIVVFFTLLFDYTGIINLIILVLCAIIPFFIDNMSIYFIVEKNKLF